MIDTARAVGRRFLRGIELYIRSFAQWEVSVHAPDYLPAKSPGFHSSFQLNQADGLIALDSKYIAKLLKLKIPKIIHSTQREVTGVSTIYTNAKRIGELAAEYFINLGFNNFAYCGFAGMAWSEIRFKEFAHCLKKRGFKNIFNYNKRSIIEWLKMLPKPVCVFACNDDYGVRILQACKVAGLSVPEEIAVLGVDNDELICGLSSPSLSSIELGFEKCGFEAAKLLNGMMTEKKKKKKKKKNRHIVVEPTEIITRQSTNIFAVDDEQVVMALIFIRENYQNPIQVKNVVDTTVLSRRELEQRFQSRLKRSIKDEIDRLRIEWIKRRLISSSDTIYNIANSLAYTDQYHFSRFFRQIADCSPKEYRRANKF
ncbi:MAG: DNA-binding transcriptional regulator [Phycisphaerales bacterium]